MTTNYTQVRNDIREYTRELQKIQPDTINAFYTVSKNALKDGALSEKTKEFIALAIGVAKQCDGCIAFHIENMKRLGATRNELGEVLGMAVYMGGGPSLMHAADALRAFDQLEQSYQPGAVR